MALCCFWRIPALLKARHGMPKCWKSVALQGSFSPCKGRGEVSPWPFLHLELLLLWPKACCRVDIFVHNLGTLSVNRKKGCKTNLQTGRPLWKSALYFTCPAGMRLLL